MRAIVAFLESLARNQQAAIKEFEENFITTRLFRKEWQSNRIPAPFFLSDKMIEWTGRDQKTIYSTKNVTQ